MKKILFLFALIYPICLIAVNKKAIRVYNDGYKVYKVYSVKNQTDKIIEFDTPDNYRTFAVIDDKQDLLSEQAIVNDSSLNFPFLTEKMIYGQCYNRVEEGIYERIKPYYYGKTFNPDSTNIINNELLTETKVWYRNNGEKYTFYPNHTGKINYTHVRQGFAQQSMSSNAVGSNQYQVRHKQYGATGGITGGYSFAIYMDVEDTFRWEIFRNKLTINRDMQPKISNKSIKTSMDDNYSPKTPSLNCSQWVKIDIKYNYDVNFIKSAMIHDLTKDYLDEVLTVATANKGFISFWENGEQYYLAESKNKACNSRHVLNNETQKVLADVSKRYTTEHKAAQERLRELAKEEKRRQDINRYINTLTYLHPRQKIEEINNNPLPIFAYYNDTITRSVLLESNREVADLLYNNSYSNKFILNENELFGDERKTQILDEIKTQSDYVLSASFSYGFDDVSCYYSFYDKVKDTKESGEITERRFDRTYESRESVKIKVFNKFSKFFRTKVPDVACLSVDTDKINPKKIKQIKLLSDVTYTKNEYVEIIDSKTKEVLANGVIKSKTGNGYVIQLKDGFNFLLKANNPSDISVLIY